MADDAVTLGILGIVFTIVIGFLVYFLQKRTDSKMESIIKSINELTRQQFEVINEEKERHKAMRDYFIDLSIGSVFMTIRQNPSLLENHAGLESIRESIEYQIESINNLITKLNEEHSE